MRRDSSSTMTIHADLRRRGHCRCYGYTYLIRRSDGLYKIGMTEILEARLKSISSGLVDTVTVVTVAPSKDARGLERRLHLAFRPQRARGEWFRLNEEHVEQIASMCDEEAAPEHTGWCAANGTESVSGEVVDQSFSGAGEWLTPSQAASRLGMSERTLWRRIDTGKLQKRIVSGRAQVYVPMAGTVPATNHAEENQENAVAVPGRQPDMLALALIEEYRQQRQQDANHVSRLTARLTELERENAVLQERLSRLSWRQRLLAWWNG